jgi:hypothetical protein
VLRDHSWVAYDPSGAVVEAVVLFAAGVEMGKAFVYYVRRRS